MVDISQMSKDETTLIQLINEEREKILYLFNNTQIEQDEGGSGVFEYYAAAHKNMLDVLQQPETINTILGEPGPDLISTMQREIDALHQDLEKAVNKAKKIQSIDNKLEINIQELNKKMENTQYEEPVSRNNIANVEYNIKKRFTHEKKRLKMVLTAILPDDADTKDLISMLVESGINDPDTYITLEDGEGVSARVAMLVKTNLFECHPEDPLQLRMVDLL